MEPTIKKRAVKLPGIEYANLSKTSKEFDKIVNRALRIIGYEAVSKKDNHYNK